MADEIRFEFDDKLSEAIIKFIIKTGSVKKPGTLLHRAWGAVGLQLLNFTVNGSPSNSIVPPLLKGVLRGSGSVFIGGKLLGTTPKVKGQGTPNTSYQGKEGEVTVGFNTAYASRIHENLTPKGSYNLGPVSRQSGDVGGGFLRSHLDSDGKNLMKLYASLIKKGL